MTNLAEILKNIIYIVFPFLCYIIYIAYCNDINKKESNLLLAVVLFISMYASIKHRIGMTEGDFILYPPIMFNIPLIIAYTKKQRESVIIMSLFIITTYITQFGLSPILCISEYILYYILFKIIDGLKINNNNYSYVISFCILKSIMYFLNNVIIFHNIKFILNCTILIIPFVISAIIITKLLEKSENIVNLNISLKELEKEKQLRESLFNIAHEIKNPLAVCKGYLDMIDFNNNSHEKYIPIIQNELKRSITLMNDMLNITKIKINPDYIDINVLLEDIKMCIKPLIDGKNIKVNIELTKEEIYLYADYTRLKHVFINIIKNSIETLTSISHEKIISIYVKLKKNKIITTIKDNGKGMTKKELKSMLLPFYNPNSSNKALGITLANEIIKCHKGEIEYRSKINRGTTTIIKLPKVSILN